MVRESSKRLDIKDSLIIQGISTLLPYIFHILFGKLLSS